jgi:hypothetical protein
VQAWSKTGCKLYSASGIRWQRMVVRQADVLAFAMLRLVRASAVFPGLPLLRGSSGEVRARSAKASIACQNIASAVAVFEGAILAVPIHYLCRPRSSRTTEPVRSPRVLGRSLPMQHQPQPPKSCVSSSFKLHAGLSNTPRRLSLFHYIRGRSPSIGSCFTITVGSTTDVTIEVGMIAAVARGQ